MCAHLSASVPIVTAEKFVEHKRSRGLIGDFKAPENILVCYQRSTMEYLLKEHPEFEPSQIVAHLYLDRQGKVGILGDWGVGAPGLAIKMEELIVHGAKRFIAVGTAGTLLGVHPIADFIICTRALAEDGVAHHYLPLGQTTIEADPRMMLEWDRFAEERALPAFHLGMAWSFAALFRETVADVHRVKGEGCSVVEMEAATLYAIAKEKDVQALTLFVISDSITDKAWVPHVRDPVMLSNLHRLADWALEFCAEDALVAVP